MEMRYYLAGPMSGLPKHNFDAFEDAAMKLRALGYTILSPHEVEHGESEEDRGTKPYSTYLREDFKLLLECGGIILLPGWTKSKGAMEEFRLAILLDMEVLQYSEVTGRAYELR